MSKTGPILLLLILACLSACSDSGVGHDPADPAPQAKWVEIHLASGAGQHGVEGSFLAEPLVVRVIDEGGVPTEGVPLRFSVIHGGGLLYGNGVPQRTVDVLSDAQGLARVEWKLGLHPDHILKVSVPLEFQGEGTEYRGRPVYAFGGMGTEVSIQWTQGFEFRTSSQTFSHDDRILETPNVLVFSDGSPDDAKVVLAAMAEECLHEIMESFDIPSTEELGIVRNEPDTKLTIYSNSTLQHTQIAYSFRFGFIAHGIDTGVYPAPDRLRQVVKHELMHVFRMLVDDRLAASESSGHIWILETWFEEGLAEHVAGGSWYPIRTLGDLEEWRAHPDHTNPISIHDWGHFSESVIERSNGFEYYPMFDLAVRYLLDERGMGRKFSDVMALFLDMEAGHSFLSAFQRRMGISVEAFEEGFFERMAEYLPSG